MKAKHTTGPWTFRTERDDTHENLSGFRVRAEDNLTIADIFPRPYAVAVNEANARLIATSPEMFVALAKLVCPGCSHELQHHVDKYGCEIERGDGYRHAEFEEALGPCGCSEDDLRDDYPDFVRALEAFKKARGE